MSGALAVEPARYAPAIDAGAYGEHRHISSISPARLDGRITADGSSGYAAEAGRYHLYAGWFCPCSHRSTIQIALHGLQAAVSVSYVDGLRDARGWAFREQTGPDPVNGFTLLREAYDATQSDYAGAVTVPVLWDRQTNTIVSTDPDAVSRDLGEQFGPWATGAVDTYPDALRAQIDELGLVISGALSRNLSYALYDAASAQSARAALAEFDRGLVGHRYLLGEALTEADIQLWVELVRYDVGVNAQGRVGPPLTSYPELWRYARELYRLPAFQTTTDFRAFAAPLTVQLDWNETL
jgi:putative glutathione S-transferase